MEYDIEWQKNDIQHSRTMATKAELRSIVRQKKRQRGGVSYGVFDENGKRQLK